MFRNLDFKLHTTVLHHIENLITEAPPSSTLSQLKFHATPQAYTTVISIFEKTPRSIAAVELARLLLQNFKLDLLAFEQSIGTDPFSQSTNKKLLGSYSFKLKQLQQTTEKLHTETLAVDVPNIVALPGFEDYILDLIAHTSLSFHEAIHFARNHIMTTLLYHYVENKKNILTISDSARFPDLTYKLKQFDSNVIFFPIFLNAQQSKEPSLTIIPVISDIYKIIRLNIDYSNQKSLFTEKFISSVFTTIQHYAELCQRSVNVVSANHLINPDFINPFPVSSEFLEGEILAERDRLSSSPMGFFNEISPALPFFNKKDPNPIKENGDKTLHEWVIEQEERESKRRKLG